MSELHVIDDLPAYALGVLDPEDVSRVERHFNTCSECRQALQAYQSTVDLLAFSVPQQMPPSHLKSRIIDTAKSTLASSKQEKRPGFFDTLKNGFRRISPALSIVSLVLIFFLGISNYLLWRQNREPQQQQKETTFLTIHLQGTSNAPEASGLIVVPKGEMVGTLVINHLPELGKELQYQLWLIKDGQRTSAAVFSVDAEGYGMVYLNLSRLIDTYDGFGITIEPFGGSPGPTGEKVLGGTLQS